MSQKNKSKLLKRLYLGECSPEDLKMLLNAIRREDDLRLDAAILTELWGDLDPQEFPPLSQDQSERIISNTMEKVQAHRNTIYKENQWKKRLFLSRKTFIRIASAAAMIVVLVYVGKLWFPLPIDNDTIEVVTAYGEQKTVELPDGSIVYVNANSLLTYPRDWSIDDARQVQLKGEAYFEVIKMPITGQKFKVQTEDMDIEVLGTVFNIKAYDDQSEVFLKQGKVQLFIPQADSFFLEMKPGQLVSYNRCGNNTQIESVRSALRASWKDGVEFFEDALLVDVFERLKQLYGVDIIAEKGANVNQHLTTGLPVDNLDMVIEIIQVSANLKIKKINENTYVVW